MTDARHETKCNRCGACIKHTYGAEPKYCDDCQQTLNRRL